MSSAAAAEGRGRAVGRGRAGRGGAGRGGARQGARILLAAPRRRRRRRSPPASSGHSLAPAVAARCSSPQLAGSDRRSALIPAAAATAACVLARTWQDGYRHGVPPRAGSALRAVCVVAAVGGSNRGSNNVSSGGSGVGVRRGELGWGEAGCADSARWSSLPSPLPPPLPLAAGRLCSRYGSVRRSSASATPPFVVVSAAVSVRRRSSRWR